MGQLSDVEDRRYGYEAAHSTSTIDNGDPKRLSRPIRSSRSSARSVKRRDPMALWKTIGRTNWRCTERMRKPFRSNASAIVPRRNTRYGSVFTPLAYRTRRVTDSNEATLVADG